MPETSGSRGQVFVSYSRKDSAFLRRLHASLVQRQFDVWVDWEDIPPSTNFRDEILPGIDASENFIFIISPDSVESVICAWELERAVQQNKRLFPVVVRTTPPDRVPEAIRDLQWLFFRAEDPLDTALEQLVWALETDLEYARTHTRLLTRAEEWSAADRRSSLLLRGTELKNAEQWLARGSVSQQRPTALQEAYIAESRRSADRRRRALLYGVASALLISFLAFWFYRAADDRQRFTSARDLALKAEELLPQRDGLRRGLLLGMESLARYRTREADALLRRGLSFLPRRVFSVDTDYVDGLALSPAGDYLAVHHHRRLRIWHLPAQRLIRDWPLKKGFYFKMPGVMLSRDATRLARALDGHTAEVVDLGQGDTLLAAVHDEELRALALSPDGGTLYTIDETGGLRAFDVAGGRRETIGPEAALTSMAMARDGSLLALADSDNRVHLYDPHSGGSRQVLPHDAPLVELRFVGEGRLLTRTDKGVTRVWSTREGEELAFLRSGGKGVFSTFRPGGPELVELLADAELRIRDPGSGARLASLDLSPESRYQYRQGRLVYNIQFAKLETVTMALDGERFALVNPAAADFNLRGHRVEVWALPGTGPADRAGPEPEHVAGAIAFGADGSRLLLMGVDGRLRLLDAQSLVEHSVVRASAGVTAADLSPDGRWLAIGTIEGRVILRDLQGSEKDTVIEGRWPVGSLAFLDQGRRIAVAAADQTLRIWSVRNGELVQRLPHHGDFRLVEFSADRRYLVTAKESDLHRVDVRQMQTDHTYYVGAGDVAPMAVAISGDGERIAMTGSDKIIRVYHASLPFPLTQFSREELDNELALSRDGRFLAAGDRSGGITVWDLASGREVLRADVADTKPFRFLDLAFSPDNRQLLAATTEGLKRIHPYAPVDLIEAVCVALPRNWEMEEWRRYFGSRSYRPVCAISPLQEEALVRRSDDFGNLMWDASRYADVPQRLFGVK